MNAAAEEISSAEMSKVVDRQGVLEVRERGHRLAQAMPIAHWPCTLGRGLEADIILTDPAVAGAHLRLTRSAEGAVLVQVLDARNGVVHGKQLEKTGSFEWPADQPLYVGHTELRLRLPDQALAPTQAWQPPSRGSGWCALLAVILVVLALSGEAMLSEAAKPGAWQRGLPPVLLGVGLVLSVWTLVWALLSRMFAGRLHWGQHLCIAASGFLLYYLLGHTLHLLAFALSWPALAAFDGSMLLLVMAVTLWRHLRHVSQRSPRFLAATMALVLVCGLAVQLGLRWQSELRLQEQLYLSDIYPPGWRVAPAVSPENFVRDAEKLRQTLAVRLERQARQDREP